MEADIKKNKGLGRWTFLDNGPAQIQQRVATPTASVIMEINVLSTSNTMSQSPATVGRAAPGAPGNLPGELSSRRTDARPCGGGATRRDEHGVEVQGRQQGQEGKDQALEGADRCHRGWQAENHHHRLFLPGGGRRPRLRPRQHRQARPRRGQDQLPGGGVPGGVGWRRWASTGRQH